MFYLPMFEILSFDLIVGIFEKESLLMRPRTLEIIPMIYYFQIKIDSDTKYRNNSRTLRKSLL